MLKVAAIASPRLMAKSYPEPTRVNITPTPRGSQMRKNDHSYISVSRPKLRRFPHGLLIEWLS